MKKNKITAEEFLNYKSHTFHESITLDNAKEYGKMCVEEYKASLLDKDAVESLENEPSLSGSEFKLVSIDGAKEALAIQSAKHQKEIDELKEKYISTVKNILYSEKNIDGDYSIDELYEELKEQLNSK